MINKSRLFNPLIMVYLKAIGHLCLIIAASGCALAPIRLNQLPVSVTQWQHESQICF